MPEITPSSGVPALPHPTAAGWLQKESTPIFVSREKKKKKKKHKEQLRLRAVLWGAAFPCGFPLRQAG